MSKTRALLVVLLWAGLVSSLGCGSSESGSGSGSESASAKQEATQAAGGDAEARSAAATSPAPPGKQGESAAPDPGLPENKALLEALAEPDFMKRIGRLAALLPTLGPEGVAQARASLESIEDKLSPLGPAEYAMLLDYWSQHDPAGAARFSIFDSALAFRLAMARQPIEDWARRDPQAAAELFLQSLAAPGRQSEVAETGLVRGWFESGKPGLEDFMTGLPIGPVRQRALALYSRMRVQRDGVDALASWIDSLPDEDRKLKLAAHRQAAIAMGKEAPLDAVAWCDEHCDGPFAQGTRELIARRYAMYDGPAAMAWVSRLPEGRERDRAVKAAFGGWWQEGRDEARAWMEKKYEEGVPDVLSPAFEVFAGAVARADGGEPGIRWALAIPDEETRKRSLENVAIIWRSMDAAAADAWLETSPLSAEQRESVRNPRGMNSFDLLEKQADGSE